MILLEQLNILFIKGFKVGGTSFEIALSKFANKNDIVTPIANEDEEIRKGLNFQHPVNYEFNNKEIIKNSKLLYLNSLKNTELRYKFFEHISAAKIKSYFGSSYFEKLTKVAIVRNPYSYIVSRYYWDIAAAKYNNKKHIYNLPFDQWLKNYPSKIVENTNLIKVDNEFVIDEVIKFENFENDLTNFERNYNLKDLKKTFYNINTKSNINKSKKNYLSLFKDNSQLETIHYLNEDYFNKFKYKKETI